MPTRVIVFDVIETLLDLRAMEPAMERAIGGPGLVAEWYWQLIQTSMTTTILGSYSDFGSVGRHALDMIARRRGVTLSDQDAAAVLAHVRSLPPHPDAVPALDRLKRAGFRLATLTNSAPAAVEAQLAHAGLAGFVERSLSVDAVRKFKPAAEVYMHAAAGMGVPIGSIRLVAAHDWDVAGALAAGAAAAFVARPGKVTGPLLPQPDIVGPDLVAVADQILVADS